jgi:hypothetical protein
MAVTAEETALRTTSAKVSERLLSRAKFLKENSALLSEKNAKELPP